MAQQKEGVISIAFTTASAVQYFEHVGESNVSCRHAFDVGIIDHVSSSSEKVVLRRNID